MIVKELMAFLMACGKGSFLNALYVSDITDKVSAKAKKNAILTGVAIPTITKETTMVVMSGISYDNRKEVKEARENGNLPENNAGLPWGKWVKGLEGYILEHNGQEYIRLYPTYNKEHKINAKTIYKVNGVPYTKEELKALNLFNDSFFKPLGTQEDYDMLNYLMLKEQVEELKNEEKEELNNLRFKLMPQVMSIKVENVCSLG